jgi:hypothetical protein
MSLKGHHAKSADAICGRLVGNVEAVAFRALDGPLEVRLEDEPAIRELTRDGGIEPVLVGGLAHSSIIVAYTAVERHQGSVSHLQERYKPSIINENGSLANIILTHRT